MITALASGLNIALGIIYTSYGLITIYDLKRGWRERGLSHFGLAWVAMAFTCGPHHFEHGLHLAVADTVGGPLDVAVVLVGLPAGLTWFLLRIEAVRGGRGDRDLGSLPQWVEALPTLAAVYLVALVTMTFGILQARGATFDVRLLPNLALVVLYMAIGVVLLRTQLVNHRVSGGWSLSGLSLTIVFPTCAIMHGVWAVYAATGQYQFDIHLLVIDILAVPAAIYFLWVVWALAMGQIADWNSGAGDARRRRDRVEESAAIARR